MSNHIKWIAIEDSPRSLVLWVIVTRVTCKSRKNQRFITKDYFRCPKNLFTD